VWTVDGGLFKGVSGKVFRGKAKRRRWSRGGSNGDCSARPDVWLEH